MSADSAGMLSPGHGSSAGLHVAAERPDASDALVQLTDVSYCYPNGFEAVANLSVTIPRGRVTAVIGPSGCGKSTLLRMISGLAAPSAGELTTAFEAAPGKH